MTVINLTELEKEIAGLEVQVEKASDSVENALIALDRAKSLLKLLLKQQEIIERREGEIYE